MAIIFLKSESHFTAPYGLTARCSFCNDTAMTIHTSLETLISKTDRSYSVVGLQIRKDVSHKKGKLPCPTKTLQKMFGCSNKTGTFSVEVVCCWWTSVFSFSLGGSGTSRQTRSSFKCAWTSSAVSKMDEETPFYLRCASVQHVLSENVNIKSILLNTVCLGHDRSMAQFLKF